LGFEASMDGDIQKKQRRREATGEVWSKQSSSPSVQTLSEQRIRIDEEVWIQRVTNMALNEVEGKRNRKIIDCRF
jgi:hypothetical protein